MIIIQKQTKNSANGLDFAHLLQGKNYKLRFEIFLF